jgi:hypothetical protein
MVFENFAVSLEIDLFLEERVQEFPFSVKARLPSI